MAADLLNLRNVSSLECNEIFRDGGVFPGERLGLPALRVPHFINTRP